jgi:hypothetical protein
MTTRPPKTDEGQVFNVVYNFSDCLTPSGNDRHTDYLPTQPLRCIQDTLATLSEFFRVSNPPPESPLFGLFLACNIVATNGPPPAAAHPVAADLH